MMNTNRNTQGHTGKWLLAVFLLAPVQLAAKGCETGVVGDDTAVGGAGTKPNGTATGGASPGTSSTARPGVGGAATGGVSSGAGAAGSAGASSNPNQMCGGLQGIGCGAKQYCRYELTALCGAADQTGICTPIPEACDMMYAPVCGCDDKTYGNDCVAAAAGVSVAFEGECAAGPSPDNGCGGITGKACSAGQYCKYASAAQCGAADQMGTCALVPEACDLRYTPVCGCDDKTYGNDCAAAAAGVSVAHDGACVTENSPSTDCGGLTGKACSKGQYCKYDQTAQCGAADQMGTCTLVPEACDMMYAPVCGCDDKTYSNDCVAAAAGVSVARYGACVTENSPSTDCGGITGKACAKGQYCKYELA
ncbi:MAG: Kazal-type serine protease inhibitor domain-containing protein, partial [Myxococcales bacterium]